MAPSVSTMYALEDPGSRAQHAHSQIQVHSARSLGRRGGLHTDECSDNGDSAGPQQRRRRRRRRRNKNNNNPPPPLPTKQNKTKTNKQTMKQWAALGPCLALRCDVRHQQLVEPPLFETARHSINTASFNYGFIGCIVLPPTFLNPHPSPPPPLPPSSPFEKGRKSLPFPVKT